MTTVPQSHGFLERIAIALERMVSPSLPVSSSLGEADAFSWQAETGILHPVKNVNRMPIDLLLGIEHQTRLLMENTANFAQGYAANNALLWGARGSGKSSLVKAVHAHINHQNANDRNPPEALALVEIHREDLPSLPRLLSALRTAKRQCIIFCDDLSFDGHDESYKSLKTVLEGGIEGRPHNVIFYATSNRRHMMPRHMIENERSDAINPSETVEEKVSLSDRFGLWLGFHHCDQDTYLAIVTRYAAYFDIPADAQEIHKQAIEWSVTRGSRSGRVAWQFIQSLAGRYGKNTTIPS